MIIDSLVLGVFQENCYIVGEKPGGEAVVIDPGDDVELILEVLKQRSLICRLIVHTHAHIDHCMATPGLVKAAGAVCCMPLGEKEIWEAMPFQARAFGIEAVLLPLIDRWLKDGDVITWGDTMSMEVLDTPGHTPGGVTYRLKRNPEPDLLFVGDALFCGSIGRTDLIGGDYNQLINSIRSRLLALPDNTIVLSGHGPATTIGQERRFNPFLLGPECDST